MNLIKKKLINILNYYYLKKHKLFLNRNIALRNNHIKYLSFGENCLPDNILKRYNMKSFTTPFSHGRSNIEYILAYEKENYQNFLNTNYIKYEQLNEKVVPRNKYFNQLINTYHPLHNNGFEFTHHDILQFPELKIKFQNRINKLINFPKNTTMVILYHHRISEGSNIKILIKNLKELKILYQNRGINTKIVLFYQEIISEIKKKHLLHKKDDDVQQFIFFTHQIWEGDDPNILWAKCDENLIFKMMRKIANIK